LAIIAAQNWIAFLFCSTCHHALAFCHITLPLSGAGCALGWYCDKSLSLPPSHPPQIDVKSDNFFTNVFHFCAGSPFPPSPPWQADWRRHYEDSSGEAISLPSTLNRRGKKLVRRREKEAETDEEVLADQEGLERVGLRGLQWMKALVDTPRRRQEGMLRDMYKDMQNPISQNYLLFKSAAEGDAEDQRSSGKEEKRMQEVDEDEDVERVGGGKPWQSGLWSEERVCRLFLTVPFRMTWKAELSNWTPPCNLLLYSYAWAAR
jgi:hypothetical protein